MGIRRVIESGGLRAAACALLLGLGEPAVAAPEARAMTFFCGFEQSARDCGFTEQAKAVGRASIVDLAREGWKGVRLQTFPGDNNVYGSGTAERDDLSLSQALTGCYAGEEQWWAHSMLFPNDYVDPPESSATSWNWAVVFDFHQSAGSGPVTFEVDAMPATAIAPDRPTGLNFRGAGGDPNNPTTYSAAIGPVVRNVWYDFVYHVKWSSGSDGFFYASVNGVQKLAYTGPTLYANQGCYLKLANYHSAFRQPVSVIHARVVRGASRESVAWAPASRDVIAREIP
jgi:Polysaccharide lyase